MDGRNNGSFWPSYVDIMTTLFAIMLVLFVVSFYRFQMKQNEFGELLDEYKRNESELQMLIDEYNDIITVYSAVSKIDSTKYFKYNKEYLKHLFQINVEYQAKEYRMDKLKSDLIDKSLADLIRKDVIDAGLLVKNTIETIESSDSTNNIKFLVVIEGQSSKVRFDEGDWMNNYTLSYLRAQFLDKFWKSNGIDLSAIPKCEVIISGSGEDGLPRIIPDEESLRAMYPDENEYKIHWTEEETKNQRFLVHIVPVIGNIDVTKEKLDQVNRRNK